MWELTDPDCVRKIAKFASNAVLVTWSGTAERDIASDSEMTKAGVLEAIIEHISNGYIVHADYMKNGDLAYIFDCFVGRNRRYVKLKFWMLGEVECMHIFSAHSHR